MILFPVKTRGKQAKNMAVQRTLQTLLQRQQSGNGPLGSSLGWSEKTAKRKRSTSKSQTRTKRKRSTSKSQTRTKHKRTKSKSQPPKRKQIQTGGLIWRPWTGLTKGGGKRKQTGGAIVQPHYPLGNYPLTLERMMKGGKRKRSRSKSQPPKRKRTQTGGMGYSAPLWAKLLGGRGKRKRRKQTGKKRKPRKQTGGRRAGKKRKPRKQTGGRKTGKKRTGKKRNTTKPSLEDIFS